MFSHKLQSTNIRIQVEKKDDPEFACFPGEFQQILTNVLSNAIEAISGPGMVRVRIATSIDWKNRERAGLRITIGDTGSGMSDKTARRITEPFFTTKNGTGTGLGMWVVQDLLKKLGGAVSVSSSQSSQHRGTVVSIFVPSQAKSSET